MAFVVTKNVNYGCIYGAVTGGYGSDSLHVGFYSNTSLLMNYWGNDFNPTIVNKTNDYNLLAFKWLPGTGKSASINYVNSPSTTSDAGPIGTMSGGGAIGNVVRNFEIPYEGYIKEIIFLTGSNITDANIKTINDYFLSYRLQTIPNLQLAGFTLSDLRAGGYTVSELKAEGCTDAVILAAGYTVSELTAGGYTASYLTNNGYNISELKAGGYTASEMKGIYLEKEIREAGYTVTELKQGGYEVNEIFLARYPITDLRAGGYTDKVILSKAYNAGYTVTEMKQGGYTASQLKKGSYSAKKLRAGGYTALELKEGGYPLPKLKKAGYTSAELIEAGYNSRLISML